MDVNVVRSATIEEHSLLRDQLCFGQQKWLKGGGTIGSDPKLEAELVALIRGAGGCTAEHRPCVSGRACRMHVAERFSVERMADGYEAAYRRVLEAPVAAAYRTVEEPAPVAMLSSSVG